MLKPAIYCVVAAATLISACGQEPAQTSTFCTDEYRAGIEAKGLGIRTLATGYGERAEPGDLVTVHYTGWLYDATAADGRGTKFDSSVDRGDRFQFRLGEGRVIKGWDEGVACMLIGEKRELTIPPEMGYGDRGAGGVIPPGATLVFDVELFAVESPADSG